VADARNPFRQLFDQLERSVGRPLETITNTAEFASAMALGKRLQRQIEESTGELLATYLHRFGLPALRDVSELSQGLGRIERRLQQLSHELEIARDAELRRPPEREVPGEEP
jgi:hypothetical protein